MDKFCSLGRAKRSVKLIPTKNHYVVLPLAKRGREKRNYIVPPPNLSKTGSLEHTRNNVLLL